MAELINRRRGETRAQLDGESYTLCLTLGALAELESAFGAGNLVELAERFESRRLRAGDLTIIIAAGLRGAGYDLDDRAVAAMRCEGGLAAYVGIVARLLDATFGEGPGDARPSMPQDAI